jgi:hypothetical protein
MIRIVLKYFYSKTDSYLLLDEDYLSLILINDMVDLSNHFDILIALLLNAYKNKKLCM